MRKKYYKMLLLGRVQSNSTEVLISTVLTNSYISHDEFISVNNVLREYDDIKKEIKNLKTSTVMQRL